ALPAAPPTLTSNLLGISLDGKSAVFEDVDGDLVTVKTDKGKFDLANFTTVVGPQGGIIVQEIHLTGDADFIGKNASITITAQPSVEGGDVCVDIGYVNADGLDLGKVSIAGDLAVIDAGSGVGKTRGVGSL